ARSRTFRSRSTSSTWSTWRRWRFSPPRRHRLPRPDPSPPARALSFAPDRRVVSIASACAWSDGASEGPPTGRRKRFSGARAPSVGLRLRTLMLATIDPSRAGSVLAAPPRPSSRRRVAAITRNTFREAVRDRVLYNLVLFVLLLSVGAIFLGAASASH